MDDGIISFFKKELTTSFSIIILFFIFSILAGFATVKIPDSFLSLHTLYLATLSIFPGLIGFWLLAQRIMMCLSWDYFVKYLAATDHEFIADDLEKEYRQGEVLHKFYARRIVSQENDEKNLYSTVLTKSYLAHLDVSALFNGKIYIVPLENVSNVSYENGIELFHVYRGWYKEKPAYVFRFYAKRKTYYLDGSGSAVDEVRVAICEKSTAIEFLKHLTERCNITVENSDELTRYYL